MEDPYRNRYYAEGYPDLDRLGLEWYCKNQEVGDTEDPRPMGIMRCIGRLLDLENSSKKVAVIGCGPRPMSVQNLLAHGYDPVGVEPVKGWVESARAFLDDDSQVEHGSAEAIPLPDQSQKVVLLEGVLEHVDSPQKSVGECFRVLEPGGVLFVETTNRHRMSLSGKNGEYNLPFYNWFPALVKESYVLRHLHYDPTLANYSRRPAVHWFTYVELCMLGRAAGFAQFYSKLDLAKEDDDTIQKRWVTRMLYRYAKTHAWLRALALFQFGNAIFMLKRFE